MSLTNPMSKTSKSDKNQNICIYILEKPEDILHKSKKAVTDSDTCVRYDKEDKPGVSNLMQIYAISSGMAAVTMEEHLSGYPDGTDGRGGVFAIESSPGVLWDTGGFFRCGGDFRQADS